MKSENTRYRLAQSMAECMRTTPVESITIRQIVDKCGVTLSDLLPIILLINMT